jgi:hypothetical protein
VAAAILLVALFRGLHAKGFFLAEADRVYALGGDSKGDQVLLDGAGAAIAQSEVVFGRTALVAMTLDRHPLCWIAAQVAGSLGQSSACVGPDIRLVKVEKSVADFSNKDFVLCCLCSRGSRGGHGNSGGGVGGTTGTAGGNRVGGRSGGRNLCGTLRVDRADVGSDGQLRRVRRSPTQR